MPVTLLLLNRGQEEQLTYKNLGQLLANSARRKWPMKQCACNISVSDKFMHSKKCMLMGWLQHQVLYVANCYYQQTINLLCTSYSPRPRSIHFTCVHSQSMWDNFVCMCSKTCIHGQQ